MKPLIFLITFPILFVTVVALYAWQCAVTLFYMPVDILDTIDKVLGEGGASNN